MEINSMSSAIITLIVFAIFIIVYIILEIINDKKREELIELQKEEFLLSRNILMEVDNIKELLDHKTRTLHNKIGKLEERYDLLTKSENIINLIDEYKRIKELEGINIKHTQFRKPKGGKKIHTKIK